MTELPATTDKSAPMRVTGRLKRALDAMVWEGKGRAEAAALAGLRENSLYVALRRPHVKAHYLDELATLRTSERARNVHVLAEVRDVSGNDMARVAAAKALEPPAAQAAVSVNIAFAAGYVIDLAERGDPPPPARVIEHQAEAIESGT